RRPGGRSDRPALSAGLPRQRDHRLRPRRAAQCGVGRGREPLARPEGPDGNAAGAPLTARERQTVTRTARQARVVEILAANRVRSQPELQALLAQDGIAATQATISRDLDELGAVKVRAADGGAGRYVVPEDGTPVQGAVGGTDRLSRLLGD